MNIAILGGSFDPPHIWHFWTAQQVLENVRGTDQVWWVPDCANAFKPIIAPPQDRMEMLHLMETGRIRASNIALTRGNITYTVSVVQDLLAVPNNRYSWIVGSDVLGEFTRWRDYQKLSRLIQFLVFPRKDYPIRGLPPGFKRVEGNMMVSNVSSSMIRQRVRLGLPVKGLVFPQVEEYIIKRNLYR